MKRILLLATWLVAATPFARAQCVLPLTAGKFWVDPNVTYVVCDNMATADISQTTWRYAIEDGFAVWNQVSGSSLNYTYDGETSLNYTGYRQNQNGVGWVDYDDLSLLAFTTDWYNA